MFENGIPGNFQGMGESLGSLNVGCEAGNSGGASSAGDGLDKVMFGRCGNVRSVGHRLEDEGSVSFAGGDVGLAVFCGGINV